MGNQSTLDRPVISHWQKNGTARKFEALIRAEQWLRRSLDLSLMHFQESGGWCFQPHRDPPRRSC
jgi:hypothetical protein